jgi:peptidoglycan hydrolase-like protein with peptidoglycan-binding domain
MLQSLTQSISDYLNKNQHHSLLLLSTISLLTLSGDAVSIAAPIQMAQMGSVGRIQRPNLQIGSRGERVAELQAALKLLGFYPGRVDGIYQESTARAVYQFKQAAGLIPNNVVDGATWQRLFPSVSQVAINPTVRPVQAVANTSIPQPINNNFPIPQPQPTNNRINNTVIPKPQPNFPQTTTPPKTTPPKATPSKTPTSPKTSDINIQPTPANQRDANIQYTSAGWPILRIGNGGPEVIKLQKLLKTLGFLKGPVDGDFGVGTQAAVKEAQIRYGLEPDGVVGGASWQTFLQRLR